MMQITPTLSDFSSGFVSKRMRGRVDNASLIKGAKEMLNCYAGLFGEVRKRAALEHKIYSVCDGDAALIKWSINKEVDLILVFSAGSIKVLNVSDGQEPAFMVDSSAVPINITSYPITTSILSELDYAQNLRELVVVHPSFKPIRFEFAERDADTLWLNHGYMEFTGNIASTKETTKRGLYKDVGYNQLKTALGGVQTTNGVTKTLSVTDSSVKISGTVYPITSVQITRTAVVENLRVWGGVEQSNFPNGTYYESSGSTPERLRIEKKQGGNAGWEHGVLVIYSYELHDCIFDFGAGTSWASVLALCRDKLSSGRTYYAYNDKKSHSYPPSYVGYTAGSYSEVIRINYGSASYKDMDDSGDVLAMVLTIPVQSGVPSQIVVNGNSVSVGESFSRLAPWMDYDVDYECARGGAYLLNQNTTLYTARKSIDDAGNEYISFTTGGTPFVLRRDSGPFTGKIGVIVTPFYRGGPWPSSVAYHAGKLLLGAGNVIYASKVNEYQNFSYFEEVTFESTEILPSDEWEDEEVPEYVTVSSSTQQVGASSAMKLKLATDEDEIVQWMLSAQGLHVGTATSEWYMPEGVDATNVQIHMIGRTGSARMKPRFCDGRVLFVTGNRRQIFAIDPQNPAGATSMTDHAEDLFTSDIIALDFRQYPTPEVFVVLANGQSLRGRMGPSGVYGWSQIVTHPDDLILDVVVTFSGDEDAVFFLTSRTGNGTTKTCLERLYSDDSTSFAGRRYLDSSVYAATPSNSLAGLTRFYGKSPVEARFLTASGEYAGLIAVSSGGTASLYTPYGATTPSAIPSFTEVHVGIPYEMAFETQNIDGVETEGLGKTCGKLYLRTLESGDLNIEAPDGAVQNIALPEYPFTGSVKDDMLSTGGETPDKSVRIISSKGEPLTIQSIRLVLTVGEAS